MNSHFGVVCDYCLKLNFFGKRFKCRTCHDYDLCEKCYYAGKTSKTHSVGDPVWCLLTEKDYEKKLREATAVIESTSVSTARPVYFNSLDLIESHRGLDSNALQTRQIGELSGGERNTTALIVFANLSIEDGERELSAITSESRQDQEKDCSEKLVKDFGKLFLDETASDVTFDVRGSLIRAHRAILMARSTVFAGMLQHSMSESRSGVIKITDFAPDAFHEFLTFLYTAKLEKDLAANVVSLYELADKYFIDDLKAKCLKFMTRNIDNDTFCDFTYLACKHSEVDLLQSAKVFFSKNMKVILRSAKWKRFLSENPIEANELLINALPN